MTLFALWLAMVGLADLVRWQAEAGWRRQIAGLVVAGVAVLAAAGLGGLGAGATVLLALLLGALVAVWLASSWAAVKGRGPVWLPFVSLGLPGVVLLAASGQAPQLDGALARWYADLPVPSAAGLPFASFAVVVGGLLFLQATANVVVRLVLSGAGSPAEQSEGTLKGGRLLGPMERTFIFALGVAGELTAASVIVAAKGLLRFPEISRGDSARVDELTEYFLVGSLSSWLLALLLLPLT